MTNPFNNRVFGCVIVKAINSNFNADFTHQPRTLPDGRVYATDKAFKYSVRHYLKNNFPEEKLLYYKRSNQSMNPLSLDESYTASGLGNFEADDKFTVLRNLLTSIDVKLFGSTFAAKSKTKKINLSVHGPVQINHGLNQYFKDGRPSNDIYSEQISSPFRSDSEEGKEAAQATLGRQSKLREGHYVYHFSINPQNLHSLLEVVQQQHDDARGLTERDVIRLKEAMCRGVSYFDSSAKAGSDNELLLWVQLKDNSRLVLPSFTEMVKVTREEGQKVRIDLSAVSALVGKLDPEQIERVEVYSIPEATELVGAPAGAVHYHLLTGNPLS